MYTGRAIASQSKMLYAMAAWQIINKEANERERVAAAAERWKKIGRKKWKKNSTLTKSTRANERKTWKKNTWWVCSAYYKWHYVWETQCMRCSDECACSSWLLVLFLLSSIGADEENGSHTFYYTHLLHRHHGELRIYLLTQTHATCTGTLGTQTCRICCGCQLITRPVSIGVLK